MPLVPLDRITAVDIDVEREVQKLAIYHGPATRNSSALNQVFSTFKNLKVLKFFRLVYERLGNKETGTLREQRTFDVFAADIGHGDLFFIVDISLEALGAFLDDGLVLAKLREWLAESCRRVVDTSTGRKPMEKWDRAFYGKGTLLPPGVKVIPFYSENFAPGVPAVMLVIIKA